MRRLLACPLLICAAAVALAGCGAPSGASGADPAAALPADAPVYLELVVRPEGDQKAQMEKLLAKVLHTDRPGEKLVELLESIDHTGHGVSYAKDVEPWLGRRAGIALSDLQSGEPSFITAVAARDADAAAAAVARQAARDKDRQATYKDVDYWVDSDGAAAAVAGDYVLSAGSERLIKRAIDAHHGASLAESERFKRALEPLPEGRAGTIYVDAKRILDGVPSGPEKQMFKQFLGGADLPPTAMAVLAEEDVVAIENRANPDDYSGVAKLLAGAGYFGGTTLLGELPGDAWAAAGVPKLGETAKTLVQTFAGSIGGALLGGQLERQLGIDLDRDVYSWIGDVAVFARGKSVPELDGGAVIEVTDKASARTALPRLLGLLQQQAGVTAKPVAVDGAELAFEITDGSAPRSIFVALGGDRVVVGYGRAAAQDGLRPKARLADSELWDRAGASLDGLAPALLLDAPTILGLIEGAAHGDADFAQAKPYLEAISVIASGTEKQDGVVRSRFSIGVK